MSNELVVVGIGSSAGGLEALQGLFTTLPTIPNCAFIIAQHLSPTHKSMMVDLLSRVANLPVLEAKNGLVIRAKTVYMTPENTDIYVKNGKIYLKTLEQAFGPKPSVNYFLSSLATAYQDKAIGVILSGTGSDGAFGVRTIKAEGGITLAQSPSTAKYDGMPVSAINTGKVDLVVPIESIGSELKGIIQNMGKPIDEALNETHLGRLFRIVFNEKGVDFSLYKKSTIIRRIERRLSALKIESLPSYVEILKNDSGEINALYQDILIGVTQFFRDKEVYAALRGYIEGIVAKKEQGEEIRFWSIGCSTGEEPYSLAILLSDVLGEKINRYKIKIFATDIDDEALKIGRTGVYAEASLLGMEKRFIQKYFTVQKNQYEVKKSIRELVIFSKHNILSDSPFLRMDLMSCRNVIIYFETSLQNKFFPIVHYALKDAGILVLGKSETVGSHYDLYTDLDKTHKIYKAQYTGIKEPPRMFNFSTKYKDYNEPKQRLHKNDEEALEEKVVGATMEYLLNQCVVINSSHEIVYIKGIIPYLQHGEGKVSNNIFRSVSEEISLDLRSTISEAQKNKEIRTTSFRSIRVFEDVVRYLRVVVVPMQDERNEEWLSILFFQGEKPESMQGHANQGDSENQIIQKLSLELTSTKAHLQNVIEELETSYEEMQSLNEELQSSNEELQSSNEELETTNEELQSTNEELQTAYTELKALYDDKEKRATQLEDLSTRLREQTSEYRKQKEMTEAILDTAPIAITMTDDVGNIVFVNAVTERLFGLSKKQIMSRTYDAPTWKIKGFGGEEVPSDQLPFSIIKKTYEPVVGLKHTVQTQENILYLSITGAPLFDFEGRFYGAVFSLVDLTEMQRLKTDIKNYENSWGEKHKSLDVKLTEGLEELKTKGQVDFFEAKFDFMQYAMLDLSAAVRNKTNSILLLLKTLSYACRECKKQEEIAGQVNAITALLHEDLEESIAYYGGNFQYKHVDFKEELKRTFEVLSPTFEEQNIAINLSLDSGTSLPMSAKQLKYFLLGLCEFFFTLNHSLENNDAGTLHVATENDKNKRLCVLFRLEKKGIEGVNITNSSSLEWIKNRFANTLGGELSLTLENSSLHVRAEFL